VDIQKDAQDRGRAVLIVDDNAAVRKTLARAFLFHGFKTCSEAENRKEAIEIVQKTKPDVIEGRRAEISHHLPCVELLRFYRPQS
jgi:CheY-like chemotaxis protein